MTIKVIDTNVAIAANGRDTHADAQCQLSCVEELRRVVTQDIVAIDANGLIMQEYSGYLAPSGQPGVGDRFYKYVFDHQYIDDKCVRVALNLSADTSRVFDEFPGALSLQNFDRSDRKFVAVALGASQKPTICNAVDSDYFQFREALEKEGVNVIELCPQHAERERG